MKITANMVTVTRIVLMPIPGYLLYGDSSALLSAFFLIIVLGLTDWLDGIMARKEGPSVLGGLLDPIADKIFIAVIYLPLTDRGVIPLYITATIFARDFIVTALRTSLSLRGAPMRTSKLAKYKTAIQMTGIGYVILYLAYLKNPDAPLVWVMILGPMLLPLGLIISRFLKRIPQGPRSATMFLMMMGCAAVRIHFGPEIAILVTMLTIASVTVVSGFSYLVDAWSALKGQPGSYKEVMRFLLDGVLVPVAFVQVLGYNNTVFASIASILILTLELTVGGLGNLLASQKKMPSFRLMAAKSVAQVVLAAGALSTAGLGGVTCSLPEEAFIGPALAITFVYASLSFWRHRRSYLLAI